MTYQVATFYKFVPLPDAAELRAIFLEQCEQAQLVGTILLAQEGINATVAGSPIHLQKFLASVRKDSRFTDIQPRYAEAREAPFARMKVKVKAEIVTFGYPGLAPEQAGTYVAPEAWNQLISDPEVLVIDTRNDYEVGIGSFTGAVNPKTNRFRDFATYAEQQLDPAQHPKVAMFCTGGIRCEKASAYLLQQGFEEVYHLKGGILGYLESVPKEESLWEGECFVFDERVAVGNGLAPGSHTMCKACGHPVSVDEQAGPFYQESQYCPHCFETKSAESSSD